MTEQATAAMPVRARIVLIQDGAVALIERQRAGRTYYAFPGGGVDLGETPEDAVVREAREELGLTVRVRRLVATVHFNETDRPSGPTISTTTRSRWKEGAGVPGRVRNMALTYRLTREPIAPAGFPFRISSVLI